MSNPAPPLDTRDAASLRGDLATDVARNVAGWQPVDPSTGKTDETTAALIGVFARFCEVTIERLNRVPEKNFLAFLDLLGVSRMPPQPARVPLTFTLAAGSIADAVVPAGTRASATPSPTAKDPVIFETERELTVAAVNLQTVLAVDAEHDSIGDHSALPASPGARAVRIFAGDRPNEHLLYVGHLGLGAQNINRVEIQMQAQEPPPGETELRASDLLWETWDGTTWRAVSLEDITPPATFDGVFAFTRPHPIPPSTIAGVTNCWMRCRPARPLSPSLTPVSGMFCAGLLPSLFGLQVSTDVAGDSIAPDAVLLNGQPLDVTKPFLPFGERPVPGDALYVASGLAFAQPGATVTLVSPVINPTGGGATFPPPTRATANLTLRWEIWTGAGWTSLGTSSPSNGANTLLRDDTRAFTRGSPNTVEIDVPAGVVPTTLNGVTSYWIRVQIASGSYVVDPAVDAPVFAPPMMGSMALDYEFDVSEAPADVITYNNREYENLTALLIQGGSRPPFRALPALQPALYVAFSIPAARKAFPRVPISLYHGLQPLAYGERVTPLHPDVSVRPANAGGRAEHTFVLTNSTAGSMRFDLAVRGQVWSSSVSPSQVSLAPGESREVTVTVDVPSLSDLPVGASNDRGALFVSMGGAIGVAEFETQIAPIDERTRRIRWEYWNGTEWTTLSVADDTEGLTTSGAVELLGPSDIAVASFFGTSGYWVRALFERGEDALDPRLQTMALNTTVAIQAVTVLDELLGSSDASASQQFRTVRAPVLRNSQMLEVRENDVWVAWSEVPDLYASGPQDRHYVLDALTGEILFGDGVQGRIPPRGTGNIRIARYRTGGGSVGNVAAGTVGQMRTTVPLVTKVINVEAAAGGADAESMDEVVARAPRTLRHGDRAVAAQDYEDLARLASPEVARAKCVPVRRLQSDPLGRVSAPGVVSVIVVPESTAAKPLPSMELLTRVTKFLDARQTSVAEVAAVGPLYVRIDVVADVVLKTLEGASRIEETIRARISAFLHPLTGGRDGAGWDFGRLPHPSDLHAVIGDVPTVDHVRELDVLQVEELEDAAATGRFLVYSGRHQITLSLAPVK